MHCPSTAVTNTRVWCWRAGQNWTSPLPNSKVRGLSRFGRHWWVPARLTPVLCWPYTLCCLMLAHLGCSGGTQPLAAGPWRAGLSGGGPTLSWGPCSSGEPQPHAQVHTQPQWEKPSVLCPRVRTWSVGALWVSPEGAPHAHTTPFPEPPRAARAAYGSALTLPGTESPAARKGCHGSPD